MSISEISNSIPAYTPPQTNNRTAAQADATQGVRESTQAEQKSAEKTQAQPEELKSAVEKIQNFVNATPSSAISFSVDTDSGSTVVKVVDRNTKEVIRQIPSQEMLEMASALDRLQGLLVKNQA